MNRESLKGFLCLCLTLATQQAGYKTDRATEDDQMLCLERDPLGGV